MKIAIFSDNFYPELSGIADSIIQLSLGLAKLGHQVCFFVPKYSKKNYQTARRPLCELKLHNNITIKRLSSLPFPSSTKQSRLVVPNGWRYFAVKKFNPDIIHSQLFFGVGLEGLWAAKALRCPIIGTNHTRLKEFLKNGLLKSNWVAELLVRYMIWYYNSCDFVTAPSKTFLKEMIHGGVERQSCAIANPVDSEIFNNLVKIGGAGIREKYNFNQPLIVYAGRLADEKKIDVIIKAIKIVLKKYPTINLALAGHGQAEASLKKLADRLGLKRNVKFLGTLNHDDLANLYRAADGFAIASTSEVQSMTIIQAMACALPVIGVNYGSIPELVRQNNGLIFNEGDQEDLAKKIIKLISDKSLRLNLSLGAVAFASKFSVRHIAKQWEELYQKVILDYRRDGQDNLKFI